MSESATTKRHGLVSKSGEHYFQLWETTYKEVRKLPLEDKKTMAMNILEYGLYADDGELEVPEHLKKDMGYVKAMIDRQFIEAECKPKRGRKAKDDNGFSGA